MKRKPTPIERFNSLSDEEKAAEVSPFEHENLGPGLPGRPLTAAQRKQWSRIRQKARRGRPVLGQGAKIVPISIERGLLKEADAFAKAHQLKRSQLIAEGLKLIMHRAKAG
jgi:hypothetical protein